MQTLASHWLIHLFGLKWLKFNQVIVLNLNFPLYSKCLKEEESCYVQKLFGLRVGVVGLGEEGCGGRGEKNNKLRAKSLCNISHHMVTNSFITM